MSTVSIWTFLLLLCVNSIVCYGGCIWLRNSHKDLPKKILNNFQHMIPENNTSDDKCVTNITLQDLNVLKKPSQINYTATAVRELSHLTLEFYRAEQHQKKLVSNRTAWEQLQEDLYHLVKLLGGCTIEKPIFDEMYTMISEYFNTLENIVKEQEDASCTRRIIHESIKTNLLHLLSALMRKRHYQ